jgi:small subunit ribosomal protein S10
MDALLPIERARSRMPFVTTLTIQSGDRDVLERVVGDIKHRAERKGVELKGPHAESPETLSVPQSRSLDGSGDSFRHWSYTVYERRMEIVGHDEFAREVAGQEFPDGIHLDIDVERVSAPGS